MSIPFVSGCDECILADGGCCTTFFTDSWKLLILPKEVKRISEITGKDPSEFIDNDPLAPSQLEWYVSQYALADPLWVRLISVWARPTGLTDGCPFLRHEGCSLPYQDKPFLCRIYPLDFNITRGEISLPKATRCRVAQGTSSIEEILAYFHDDWKALQRRFNVFHHDFISLLRIVEHLHEQSDLPRVTNWLPL